jgi:hypothetical protein
VSHEAFLQEYLSAFDRIEGWCSPDAALMFMAYAQAAASVGIEGNVLEIGVHHGLSAIAVAAIRAAGSEFVAVDLFDDLQAQNRSGSGSGNRCHFERHMAEFFDDRSFLRCIAAPSDAVKPSDLGTQFSFCHIDGGHSAAETGADVALGAHVLMPGGLLALDDYFNPAHPGVCEGAIKFWLANGALLRPIAAGFNKVLFQKQPTDGSLEEAFEGLFGRIPHKTVRLWDTPIRLYSALSAFFDIAASSPRHLVPSSAFQMDAELTPRTMDVKAIRGAGTVHIPIRVVNRSSIPFESGDGDAPFGLSYHLMSSDGQEMQFDNPRSYFNPPIAPGEERVVEMAVEVPPDEGDYQVEVDIVWEGMAWLKNRGLETPRIRLTVI